MKIASNVDLSSRKVTRMEKILLLTKEGYFYAKRCNLCYEQEFDERNLALTSAVFV